MATGRSERPLVDPGLRRRRRAQRGPRWCRPRDQAVPRACGTSGIRRDSLLGVNDDRLPVETEPPISEDVRQRGIDVLQGLLASGKVDLDRFKVLSMAVGARTFAEFASVVRSLRLPSNSLRRRGGVKPAGDLHLDGRRFAKGRWQVGRLTKIRTGTGMVIIDLTEAEFDAWDVDIDVHTNMGWVTVIAPRGVDVRQVGKSAAVKSTLDDPIPGFPVPAQRVL